MENKKNLVVNVVDGFMGSGKSTAIINRIYNDIEKNPTQKYLIIVPYISEILRYQNNLATIGFEAIITDDEILEIKNYYKEEALTRSGKRKVPKKILLEDGFEKNQSIICSHALFMQNIDIIIKYSSNYILIIDEVINTVIESTSLPDIVTCDNLSNKFIIRDTINKKNEKIPTIELKDTKYLYTFKNNDIDIMIKENLISINENEKICNINTKNTIYDSLHDFFTENDIYIVNYNNKNKKPYKYIKVTPISLFNNFMQIYVLTYMWEAQIMKYYFDMHGAIYCLFNPLSLPDKLENGDYKTNYSIYNSATSAYLLLEKSFKTNLLYYLYMPDVETTNLKFELKNTKLYTLNNIDKKPLPNLSYTFLTQKAMEQDYTPVIKKIQKNVRTFIESKINKELKKSINYWLSKNIDTPLLEDKEYMWTTYIDSVDIIIGKGKDKIKYLNKFNFVNISAKGTNEYDNRNTLIYIADRYNNPYLFNFIKKKCPEAIKENEYALSELIQWIWRSNIRKNLRNKDRKYTLLYIASLRMLNLFIDWLNNK